MDLDIAQKDCRNSSSDLFRIKAAYEEAVLQLDEVERRIAEKEEEFQSTRKNFTKSTDSMQTALEQEGKGKAEAIRMKKKLESDVVELETALEHANAANQDTQKSIKKYHQQIREAQAKLEDEQRVKELTRDQLLAGERRANS